MNKSGRNLLGILNDLKRDIPTAAEELEIDEEELTAYVLGKKELPHTLIQKAAQTWPVNQRDFYVVEDDAPEGVLFMNAEQSKHSARVFQRGGVDYYEYRDTAMSRISSFRPEWIRELVIVEDNDPYAKAISWNNGHFLHQFTYFIGPVNFYYDVDGKRHCAEMNTGDSMYITPYAPHTFATRKNDKNELGLILAVTYGGKLIGDGQQELGVLGEELTNEFLLDYTTPQKAAGALLKMHRENLSLSQEELSEQADIDYEKIISYEEGENEPEEHKLYALADALCISRRDLLPVDYYKESVVVLPYAIARRWKNKGYSFVELASTPKMPYSKGLELSIDNETPSVLKTALQQYVYNIGEKPVTVMWDYEGEHQHLLRPGDSFFMKPFINHSFAGKDGKLLVVRIGGRLSGDAQHELSMLDRRGQKRVVGENTKWFDEKGKK